MTQVIHKRKKSLSFLNLLSTSLYVFSTCLTASVLLSRLSSPHVYGSISSFSFRFHSSIFLLKHRGDCDWHAVSSSGNFANSVDVFSVRQFQRLSSSRFPFISQPFVVTNLHQWVKEYGKKNYVLMALTFRTCRYLLFTMHFNKINNFKSTVMSRITTFRPTTDRIYHGGPIIL